MPGSVSRSFWRWLATAVLLGAAWCAPALAAAPAAVDVVTVKSGRPLRGAILTRQPDGSVLMAVSREWLEQTDPKEFARQSRQSDDEQRAAWSKTKERIEAILDNPPAGQAFRFFLKQERARLAKLLDDNAPKPTAFLLMEIPANRVGKLQPAAPPHQKLAMFAWKQGLSKVESRSAASLQDELEAAGVDVDGPVPDLSDMLPPREQSEAEWSARLALVRHALDGGLDFQGMDDTLVRTGEGRELQLAAILPKLLTRDVDALLGDLLEPNRKPQAAKKANPNSYQSAIKVANQAGQRGFRVTRLDLNAERLAVSVDTEFVVRFSDDDWEPIWKHVEAADGTKVRPQAELRIAEDPQVKTILESMKGLGLAADDTVTQAIRVGAATMAAQQAADAKFSEFIERYLKRLDGPVLPILK